MIQLTRLNNSRLAVNPDLIKYVEQAPDTVITLINGEKLVVRETAEEIIERFRNFRRSVLASGGGSFPCPVGPRASSAPCPEPPLTTADEGPDCG
jgi:uncharacterized protein YlzI (FlbEa/FlbD family)